MNIEYTKQQIEAIKDHIVYLEEQSRNLADVSAPELQQRLKLIKRVFHSVPQKHLMHLHEQMLEA